MTWNLQASRQLSVSHHIFMHGKPDGFHACMMMYGHPILQALIILLATEV